MAAPVVKWKEGQGWASAVAGEVSPYPLFLGIWALPVLPFSAAWLAFATGHPGWGALAVVATAGLLGAVAWGWAVAGQQPDALARKATCDAWNASRPLRLAWDNLPRALVGLTWYRDVRTVRQVEEDDGQGGKRTREVVEEHREYPEVFLTSEDPECEVRLLVATTSGLATSSQADAKGSDLADWLGLNGWHVSVSPHAVPGYIEIRIARSSGRDLYGN